VPRPVKELKGFAKVNSEAGRDQADNAHARSQAFSFYDVKKHDWSAEPVEFTISVGGSSINIQLRGKFHSDSLIYSVQTWQSFRPAAVGE